MKAEYRIRDIRHYMPSIYVPDSLAQVGLGGANALKQEVASLTGNKNRLGLADVAAWEQKKMAEGAPRMEVEQVASDLRTAVIYAKGDNFFLTRWVKRLSEDVFTGVL